MANIKELEALIKLGLKYNMRLIRSDGVKLIFPDPEPEIPDQIAPTPQEKKKPAIPGYPDELFEDGPPKFSGEQ